MSTPNPKGKYGRYKTIEKALRAEKWWPTLDTTACNASGPFANVMSVLLIPGTGHAYKKLECTLLGQSVRSFDLPRGSARELAESARNFCSTFGRPHPLQVRTNSWLDFLIWSVPDFFFYRFIYWILLLSEFTLHYNRLQFILSWIELQAWEWLLFP